MIDWANITPWTSLTGGLLIGLAAVLLIIFNGRVAGISGILGGLLNYTKGDALWRIAFIGGLVISPLVYNFFVPLPTTEVNASNLVLIIGGLLVGLGTRVGSGCTSGHGVCGISRLSIRSIAATGCFFTFGILTVLIHRHFFAA